MNRKSVFTWKVRCNTIHNGGVIYGKGDQATTYKIAERFDTGIENGIWSMKRIKDELNAARTDEDKYRILYFTDSTFTNVHEAIEYLKDL